MLMVERNLAVVVPAYNEEATLGQTLSALYGQRAARHLMCVVVNNASTDGTERVVGEFQREFPEFPLVMLDEPEKGTGCAVDTGFRYAVENGYDIIGRTDADARPSANWARVIGRNFSSDSELRLLGGSSRALTTDEYYRRRDNLLWPITMAARNALYLGDGGVNKVIGNNMATTAKAYQAAGGFPRTSIDKADEDHVYAERILNYFGKEAIKIDPELRVNISMRRVRKLGYAGYIKYRLDKNSRDSKSVDIRPLAAEAYSAAKS